ncbi:MAG: nuclear transport factor 2 family protein [Bryobacterales bacterium]|nr:nuclear transport factor 2 family protein [Bryobacterales bacterium]
MRFFVFLLMAGAACAQPSAQSIEQVERNWAASVVKQDFAALEKVMGDDLSYTHSTGARDTKQSYIDNLKTGKARYYYIEYDELIARPLTKDTAITICRARVQTLGNGQRNDAKLSFLHVFVLRHGTWQLVAHQSARMP